MKLTIILLKENLFLQTSTILPIFNLQLAVNTVYILSFGDSVTPGPGSGKDEKNITFRIGSY